ncbi:MAG: polyamine aminopropyltransferase [Nitrospinota bacterium]
MAARELQAVGLVRESNAGDPAHLEENKTPKGITERDAFVLFISIFIVGLCGIIYELLIGSTSSYLLGDSVKQFSLAIGLTMMAMGIGSYLSRLIEDNLISWFIGVQIALGLVGGLSVPILYLAFSMTEFYYIYMISLIVAIGTLVGLEIPLLTRILEGFYVLKFNISNVLSLDYLGALIASLLFPFFLLPFFGILDSSLIIGIINLIVGFLNLWWFKDQMKLKTRRILYSYSISVCALLLVFFVFSGNFLAFWEKGIYEDKVILSKQTKYQKVVLTKNRDDLRMYINGNLQFSSIDEYRYHESLIHIPLSFAPSKENILVLGGGDGLAVREILKYPEVNKVTIVDLDPVITELAARHPMLRAMNQNSMSHEKVTVVNKDAMKFLENANEFYDVIIADLPDPNNISLARLYSREFYKLVRSKLSKGGIFVTQSTSPFYAKKAFWSIYKTMEEAGFENVYPYHAYIPSFGDWGFVMGSALKIDTRSATLNVPTKYLDVSLTSELFYFSKDLIDNDVTFSTLDKPKVLTYYLDGWKYWR